MTERRFLAVWVVYENPTDAPGWFVARRHTVGPEGTQPTPEFVQANTLDGLRRLIPQGLFRLDRELEDEAHIVEVWL